MLLLTVALTLCFPCFSVKSHLLPHPLRPPRLRAARAFSTCQRKGLIGISRRVSKSFSLPLCIFFCPVSLFQWGANTSRPAHTHTLKQTSITWEKPNPNAQSIEVSQDPNFWLPVFITFTYKRNIPCCVLKRTFYSTHKCRVLFLSVALDT